MNLYLHKDAIYEERDGEEDVVFLEHIEGSRADHIIRAVNSHDALLESLEACIVDLSGQITYIPGKAACVRATKNLKRARAALRNAQE